MANINGIWGKKIGMTQVFSNNEKVVPVTAIDLSNWVVTQVKAQDKDGYNAVQLGKVKDRYTDQEFNLDWLKKPKRYFSLLKEVRIESDTDMVVGNVADVNTILSEGDVVDIAGTTIGKGFAGVMKRHGFSGGGASHGNRMGRRTGSIGFMTAKGRVIKGKKMPGHLGQEVRVIKNLEIIKIKPEAHVVFVKGSIPGKTGSFVFLKKR